MKKRLSQGLRKYIRRQKMIIKRIAKDNEEKKRLIRELLSRFYKPLHRGGGNMCCDICSKYDECEGKNKLKDGCCSQCSDYEYCQENNDYNDTGNNFKDNDKKFHNYY